MKKIQFYGVSALLGLTLALGVTACRDDDDPEYIEPPVVEVKNSISGMVTAMSGEAIMGATVTMDDQTTTTGTDGMFTFDDVSTGTHNMSASATDKVSKSDVVTVGTNDNQVWNVTLSNAGVKMEKKADGSLSAETKTETLQNNTAAKIEVEVEAPKDALEDEEAEIVVTPTYTESAAIATKGSFLFTRADDTDNGAYLIGSDISCSKPNVKLKKSLSLSFNVDRDMLNDVTAKKYVDGQWKDVVSAEKNTFRGLITIEVDEFATYALFCSAKIVSSTSTEAIKFAQDEWDNLYGSKEMTVTSASYTYKLGTDVEGQSNKIMAYLVEMLVRTTGSGYKVTTGTQTLNTVLPVGTAMSISGTQAVTTYTASVLGKSVSAKQYGAVTVATKTWKRNHTGGGSK